MPLSFRCLALLSLLGQLVASIGMPIPVASAKRSSLPYPCQGRKCGCQSSEACWAGACCCFTMTEKLAWAEAHGVNAPAHCQAIAKSEAKPVEEEHDCCSKAKACCPPKPEVPHKSFQMLTVVEVQGCHGKPADALGVMTMPPAIPGKFVQLRADRAPAFDWLSPFDVSVETTSQDISTPPPKLG